MIILGLILLHDVTYEAFKSYYSRYQLGVFDLVFNLFTAWPSGLVYAGYFGLLGKWGYVNRIVIHSHKATVYLLGFFGKEAEAIELESIDEIKGSKIIGTAKQKIREVHIFRRYLDEGVRERLLQVSARDQSEKDIPK